MKKIAVIGCCGSGKSTFAQQLSKVLGLPLFHLDTLYWKPGWVKTPSKAWGDLQTSLCENEQWIIDGNYKSTLDIRLNACDTVIFLDVNRYTCLYRAIKRTFTHRPRPDMAQGCEERLSLEFIKFIWDFPRDTRPVIINKMNRLSESKNVIIAHSGTHALHLCEALIKRNIRKQ